MSRLFYRETSRTPGSFLERRATPRPFELALAEAGSERQSRILRSLEEERLARTASTALLDRYGDRRGFLPLAWAAEYMRVSQAEIERLAAEGKLEAYTDGATVYVRPAIVTVAAVRQEHDQL